MFSIITNSASSDASGDLPIVQNYKTKLQALGYSPGLTGKCIRTVVHLITWLSANGTRIETLDIRVSHRFLSHHCTCPSPHGYRKNLERARWHLHRFLEPGRARLARACMIFGTVSQSERSNACSRPTAGMSDATCWRCRPISAILTPQTATGTLKRRRCCCDRCPRQPKACMGGGGTMAELASPLAKFLREYLPRDKGTSRHTVKSYALCFNLLVVFAAHKHGIRPCKLEIEHLNLKTILMFLEHLETDRGNSVSTRNARLAAIKAFFRFLEFRHPGHLDLAPQVREIPTKKGKVPLISSLDRTETRALLDAPDPGTVSGIRDRAMLCLTYNAGLRVSELVGLALEDLKMPTLDEVRIIGKGRRERILPLWKETRGTPRESLAVRPKSADRHLFLNAMGTGMPRRGFAKRLIVHAQTATQNVPSISRKRVSPHPLRHVCALHTLEATGDIRKVSLWLGALKPSNHRDVSAGGSVR